jgi:hypothetical protein
MRCICATQASTSDDDGCTAVGCGGFGAFCARAGVAKANAAKAAALTMCLIMADVLSEIGFTSLAGASWPRVFEMIYNIGSNFY